VRSIEQTFREVVESELALHPDRHAEYHREFAAGRYREGLKALEYLQSRYPDALRGRPKILDVGGGNGGFLLPFAERAQFRCFWIDHQRSDVLEQVVRKTAARVSRIVGDAGALPFASASIDVVLCIETIEHVNARALGREIGRVLRPGGICYLTTPSRVRFLLRRDPHYGIPGLLLLPDAVQRAVFHWIRPGEPYEVEHLFWSVFGIMNTLSGLRLAEVTSSNWAGPLRRFDWDWVIAQKR